MIAIVVIYAISFLLLARRFARTEGYLSGFTIFGIGAFYYYLAIPLEASLRGTTHVPLSVMPYEIRPEDGIRIGILAILSLVGFALGHMLSGFRVLDPPPDETARRARLPKSLWMLFIAAVTVVVVVYGSVYRTVIGTYGEANEMLFENSMLAGMLRYAVLGVAFAAAILIQGNRTRMLLGMGLAAVVAMWGVWTLDKNPICYAGLAVICPWVGRRSRHPIFLWGFALAVGVVICGLPMFSAYRGGKTPDPATAIREFSVMNTDARGPLASLVVTTRDESEWLLGATYRHAVEGVIPRVIWPHRGLDLAERFARSNIRGWQPGWGMGYSLLAEAYRNWGMLGGLIQYCLVGFVFGRVCMWTQQRLVSTNWPFWRGLYAVSGFMCLAIMHRGAMNQISRFLCYEFLVPIGLFLAIDYGLQVYARGRRVRFSEMAFQEPSSSMPAGSGIWGGDRRG